MWSGLATTATTTIRKALTKQHKQSHRRGQIRKFNQGMYVPSLRGVLKEIQKEWALRTVLLGLTERKKHENCQPVKRQYRNKHEHKAALPRAFTTHEQQVAKLPRCSCMPHFSHLLQPGKTFCHGRTDRQQTLVPSRCTALPRGKITRRVSGTWPCRVNGILPWEEQAKVRKTWRQMYPLVVMWLLRHTAVSTSNLANLSSSFLSFDLHWHHDTWHVHQNTATPRNVTDSPRGTVRNTVHPHNTPPAKSRAIQSPNTVDSH